MSPADLKRLVQLGEGYHLEFKRRVSSAMRIAREVLAFANTWGGTILIGVDDDGTVLGVKDTEEELFVLRNAFQAYCDPAISFSVRTVPVSRKRDVIAAEISQSDQKPHRLVSHDAEAHGTVFVRVRDQSIVASPEMIRLLEHENSPEGVRFEFGDKELLLLRYLETYSGISVDEYARIAGLSRSAASDTLVVLARAGLLELVPAERGDTFVLNQQHQQTSTG
jgi:DNA-binding transcriptional ArsR family regulator